MELYNNTRSHLLATPQPIAHGDEEQLLLVLNATLTAVGPSIQGEPDRMGVTRVPRTRGCNARWGWVSRPLVHFAARSSFGITKLDSDYSLSAVRKFFTLAHLSELFCLYDHPRVARGAYVLDPSPSFIFCTGSLSCMIERLFGVQWQACMYLVICKCNLAD